MTWLDSLKIAIIEENIDQIEKLINSVPKFESIHRAKEALALINEARIMMLNYREKTLVSMKKLRLTKAFFNSY